MKIFTKKDAEKIREKKKQKLDEKEKLKAEKRKALADLKLSLEIKQLNNDINWSELDESI